MMEPWKGRSRAVAVVTVLSAELLPSPFRVVAPCYIPARSCHLPPAVTRSATGVFIAACAYPGSVVDQRSVLLKLSRATPQVTAPVDGLVLMGPVNQ